MKRQNPFVEHWIPPNTFRYSNIVGNIFNNRKITLLTKNFTWQKYSLSFQLNQNYYLIWSIISNYMTYALTVGLKMKHLTSIKYGLKNAQEAIKISRILVYKSTQSLNKV